MDTLKVERFCDAETVEYPDLNIINTPKVIKDLRVWPGVTFARSHTKRKGQSLSIWRTQAASTVRNTYSPEVLTVSIRTCLPQNNHTSKSPYLKGHAVSCNRV